MKGFTKDAWGTIIANDLPDEYDVAAHSKADGVLPCSPEQVDSLHWELCHVKDPRKGNKSVGLVSLVDTRDDTARIILERGGDCVLQVKANQKSVKRQCETKAYLVADPVDADFPGVTMVVRTFRRTWKAVWKGKRDRHGKKLYRKIRHARGATHEASAPLTKGDQGDGETGTRAGTPLPDSRGGKAIGNSVKTSTEKGKNRTVI